MKERKTRVLLGLVVSTLLGAIVLASVNRTRVQEQSSLNSIALSTITSSIYLGNNTALDAFCAGNGTNGSESNPHVIEGLTFQIGNSDDYCLKLSNTDLHVIIKDCIFDGESWEGLNLYKCANVNVIDCIFKVWGEGLVIDESNDVMVSECEVRAHNNGIGLYKSHNCTLVGNNFLDIMYDINLYLSHDNTIIGNHFDKAGYNYDYEHTISIIDSNFSNVSSNQILSGANGIYLIDSGNSTIFNNSITDVKGNGILLESSSDNNNITGNHIKWFSEYGINVDSSTGNTVYSNVIIHYNGNCIRDSSGTNDIHDNECIKEIHPNQVLDLIVSITSAVGLVLTLILGIRWYKHKPEIKIGESDEILGKLDWYSQHHSRFNTSRGLLTATGLTLMVMGFGFSYLFLLVDSTLVNKITAILALNLIMSGYGVLMLYLSAQFRVPHLLIYEKGIKYRRPYSFLIPRRLPFSRITCSKLEAISPFYPSAESPSRSGDVEGLFIHFIDRKPMRFIGSWVSDFDKPMTMINSRAIGEQIPETCQYCGNDTYELKPCKYCGKYYCANCEEQRQWYHVDISCIGCQQFKDNKHAAIWILSYVAIQFAFLIPWWLFNFDPFTSSPYYWWSNFMYSIIFLPYGLALFASNTFRVVRMTKKKVKRSLVPYFLLATMVALSIYFKVFFYLEGLNRGYDTEIYLDLRFMLVMAPLVFFIIHVWYRKVHYLIPIFIIVYLTFSIILNILILSQFIIVNIIFISIVILIIYIWNKKSKYPFAISTLVFIMLIILLIALRLFSVIIVLIYYPII
ncbi:MAG: nitrous oxide reductase family maturation protein NosD [Candidatus Hodarchaeota archaeon]